MIFSKTNWKIYFSIFNCGFQGPQPIENLNGSQIPIYCSLAMQNAFKQCASLLYGAASNRDKCEKHGFLVKIGTFWSLSLESLFGSQIPIRCRLAMKKQIKQCIEAPCAVASRPNSTTQYQ